MRGCSVAELLLTTSSYELSEWFTVLELRAKEEEEAIERSKHGR